MIRAILYPEWYDENAVRKYPFSDGSTLTNGTDTVDPGLLLDAHVYPIGGQEIQYLSLINVAADEVTFTVADATGALCTGSLNPIGSDGLVHLADSYDRPAGVLVTDVAQLSVLGAWSLGDHTFTNRQTPFAATVVHPMPTSGLRGFLTTDGGLYTGDVWLVGGEGVVFSRTDEGAIRLDVAGDPHYTHRRCDEVTEVHTEADRFVTTINGLLPNKFGNISIMPGANITHDNVVRVNPIEGGIELEFVGSRLGDRYVQD